MDETTGVTQRDSGTILDGKYEILDRLATGGMGEVYRARHIHLQETLADDVLRLMLAHPRVKAARVATEKPDVYPDCEAVGVEVFGLKSP